jgi:hypothetical protein
VVQRGPVRRQIARGRKRWNTCIHIYTHTHTHTHTYIKCVDRSCSEVASTVHPVTALCAAHTAVSVQHKQAPPPPHVPARWVRTNFPLYVGPGSSVGIAIRYGLDGPGIESRRGRDVPNSYRPVLWPTPPPLQEIPGLFPGGKAAGAWR